MVTVNLYSCLNPDLALLQDSLFFRSACVSSLGGVYLVPNYSFAPAPLARIHPERSFPCLSHFEVPSLDLLLNKFHV